MEIGSDIQANKVSIIKGIKKAANEGADFLMTPEGSLSGYNSSFDAEELKAALDEVTNAAKKSKVGLMLGTCFKDNYSGAEQCWNQVRIYTPDGELLSAYSKILRCSPVDLPGTGEMLAYVEGHLQTFEWNGIKFGTLICNDLWASSLEVQILEVNAAKGADPINAQSGLIDVDGKRIVLVPEIGEQFFLVDISIQSASQGN
jgi:predicted amidohydrolase